MCLNRHTIAASLCKLKPQMRLNELTGLGDKVRETLSKEEGKTSEKHEMALGMYEQAA